MSHFGTLHKNGLMRKITGQEGSVDYPERGRQIELNEGSHSFTWHTHVSLLQIALSRVAGDVTPQPRHWSITVNSGRSRHSGTRRSGGCLRSELTDGLPHLSLSAVAGTPYKPSCRVGIEREREFICHKNKKPSCLYSPCSRSASPHFGRYSFPVPQRRGGRVG